MNSTLTEAGQRLTHERERLKLTLPQLASLVSVTNEQQRAFEEGSAMFSGEYMAALDQVGADSMFITFGERNPDLPLATPATPMLAEFNDEFNDAVMLLRKSVQAVEAWVGDGTAQRCPELVAAVMDATLRAVHHDAHQSILEELDQTVAQSAVAVAQAINGGAE